MLDADGNVIADDDPRLPTADDIADLEAKVAELTTHLTRSGVQVSPVVELDAKVAALVAVLIPPDADHPLRRLFDANVANHRLQILSQVANEVDQAKRGPGLVTARPEDLRNLGAKPPNGG